MIATSVDKIDEAFQDRVLSAMRRVPEFMAVVAPNIEPDYFDGVAKKNLCKIMRDFWQSYGVIITSAAFMDTLKDMIKTGAIKMVELEPHVHLWQRLEKVESTDWKYVLERMVKFIKHQRIKTLINESMTRLLPGGKYEEIEQEMAKISNINQHARVESYDYFDQSEIKKRDEQRQKEQKTGRLSISTGIKPLDDMLYARGFAPKELYIFMAPPKRGKTMSMLWFSNQAALQGYNVAHFTCEVSREICASRLDAMNSRTPTRDVGQYSAAVADRVSGIKPRGKLNIFEYPTGYLTSGEVDTRLKQLQDEKGLKTDMLVVDYLDLMKRQGGDNGSAEWSNQGPIAAELRGVGWKWGVPVVSATQINRGGAGKAVNAGKDVAGDYGKIMIADEVFCLSSTDEELKQNKLRIILGESRNSECRTIVISTAFAYGRFFQEYLHEEM